MDPRLEFWTEEKIEYLKKWWLAEQAYKIGEVLGCSKAAIIGKARRLGLKNKRDFYIESGLKLKIGRGSPKKKREPSRPRYLGLGDEPPTCEPVGFMAIRRDQCHAPLESRGADGLIMYCGEAICKRLVRDGKDWSYVDSSYCAYHYRRFNKVDKNG